MMSAGKSTIAGGRFVLAWNYDNDTDVLDVYVVPSNATRHVFHGTVKKTTDGDIGGYTELTQNSPIALDIVSKLVASGDLPSTYPQDAINGDKAEKRKRRLARIAELEEEAATLKTVVE
jgi:hypothetical protein